MKTLNDWKVTTLNNYKIRHNPSENEVHHVLDYLQAHPKLKLQRLSYPQAHIKAEAWTKALIKKNRGVKGCGKEELVIGFPDGMRFVRLIDQEAKNWEGKHMSHCVSSYVKHEQIYSLRDVNNFPSVTIEIKNNEMRQCVGKSNRAIDPKYYPYVKSFADKTKVRVAKQRELLKYLGFCQCTSEVKYFLNKIVNNLSSVSYNCDKYFKTDLVNLKLDADLTELKKKVGQPEWYYIIEDVFQLASSTMNKEIIWFCYQEINNLPSMRSYVSSLFSIENSAGFVLEKILAQYQGAELFSELKTFVSHINTGFQLHNQPVT